MLEAATDTAFTKLRGQLLLNTCLCLFNEGNAAEAKALSSRAVAKDATNAKAHHILGKACRLLGEFSMARTELCRALELEPGNTGTERELRQLEADEKANAAPPPPPAAATDAADADATVAATAAEAATEPSTSTPTPQSS